jgi:hypothetical protein
LFQSLIEFNSKGKIQNRKLKKRRKIIFVVVVNINIIIIIIIIINKFKKQILLLLLLNKNYKFDLKELKTIRNCIFASLLLL